MATADLEQLCGRRCCVGYAAGAAVIVVAFLGFLLWSVWDGRMHSVPLPVGPTGSLVAVTLVSGPVYYGRLAESRAGYVKLVDVYYVETFVADQNGRRDNRVVSRQKNDWHGPESMIIPNDKIVIAESVGAQSRLAKLIEQDKATAATK